MNFEQEFKEKKVMKKGGKSKYVILLTNSKGKMVIKKKYNKYNSEHVFHFKNEIKLLKHLKNCKFVPNIHHINHDNCTIYMSYCGLPVIDAIEMGQCSERNVYNEVRAKMVKLRKKWGVERRDKQGNVVYKVGLNNVCYKNGIIRLIDFGSENWQLF